VRRGGRSLSKEKKVAHRREKERNSGLFGATKEKRYYYGKGDGAAAPEPEEKALLLWLKEKGSTFQSPEDRLRMSKKRKKHVPFAVWGERKGRPAQITKREREYSLERE